MIAAAGYGMVLALPSPGQQGRSRLRIDSRWKRADGRLWREVEFICVRKRPYLSPCSHTRATTPWLARAPLLHSAASCAAVGAPYGAGPASGGRAASLVVSASVAGGRVDPRSPSGRLGAFCAWRVRSARLGPFGVVDVPGGCRSSEQNGYQHTSLGDLAHPSNLLACAFRRSATR